MYKIMCKKHNKKQNTVSLGNGARGHWIGDPHAKHVMMFYHGRCLSTLERVSRLTEDKGGAFIMPGTFAHFEFMFHCRQRAKKRFHDFAVFCLDYSLVPYDVYPTQLRQAVAALRYLIEDQHRDPRTIMLGGDSAGGNLVAAVLLHLANPHPTIEPLKLKHPLRAALMISPWVSFSIDTPSFTTNAKKDLLTAPAIKKAGLAYIVGTPPGDVYAEPILATPSMWACIASQIVGEVLITAGANELLCDEVVIFASKVKSGFDIADVVDGGSLEKELEKSGIEIEICEEAGVRKEVVKSRVEIEICEGEGHDEVILDYFLLSRGKAKSARAVKGWMARVL